jgi:hypothetical protein
MASLRELLARLTVDKLGKPARSIEGKGGNINVFDAEFGYLPLKERLAGVTWHSPNGAQGLASWAATMKSVGITQEPSGLLRVPLVQLPTECREFDEDKDGYVQCAIFPDDATDIGEMHLVTGPPAAVQQLQNHINQDGLALTLAL